MPELYKSSDASAPALTRDKGGLNAVLKAVLVNGYGSKQPAGWTLEFEDTTNDVCVFRNAGTGYFLRVAFDNTGYSKVRAYESMTDANTGINPTPYDFIISYNKDTSAIPWAIVADEKSFYFLPVVSKDGYYSTIHFFGDFPSLIPGDLWNFALAGTQKQNSGIGALTGFGNNSINLVRNSDGVNNINANILGQQGGNSYFTGKGSNPAYPYYGNVFIQKPFIYESADFKKPRGRLPGFTVLLHDGNQVAESIGINWQSNDIDSAVKLCTIEGTNYVAMRHAYGLIFIDMDNCWSLT